MAGEATPGTTEIACPHCRRPFAAQLLTGGSARHRGYKCPHCKLFVPEDRAAADAPLSRDPGA